MSSLDTKSCRNLRFPVSNLREMMLHAFDYLIWYGSGRISCKLLPKVSQTAYEGTLGQKNKKGVSIVTLPTRVRAQCFKRAVCIVAAFHHCHYRLTHSFSFPWKMGPMHEDPAVDSMAAMYARMQPGKFHRCLSMHPQLKSGFSSTVLFIQYFFFTTVELLIAYKCS